MFGDMIYGTAYKPFVNRILVPVIVRFFSSIFPTSLKNFFINDLAANPFMQKIILRFNWEANLLVEYFIASIIMFVSLVGFYFAIRLLIKNIYLCSDKFIDLVSLTALIALPPFFKYYSHIYDFTNLFLFTTGLVLIYKRSWIYFITIFFVSCLNKETTILLTLVFIIHHKKNIISNLLYKKLLLFQILIFIAVKSFLMILHFDNLGGLVEFHLYPHNIGLLRTYSFVDLITFALIVFLIFYQWNDKPKFLRDSIWILVPLLLLTLFFGLFDEYRDYYEAFPILLLLIFHSIAKVFNIQLTKREIINFDNLKIK